MDTLIDSYTDLLVRCISNTIYRDVSIPNRRHTGYDNERRELGTDWPSQAHSMIGTKRLRSLADQTIDVIRNDVPGGMIETGVWRGGACVLMRAICRALGADDRTIYVADSFEGLPPPDAEGYPADAGDNHYKRQALRVSLEEVKETFAAYGLLDDSVSFVKGWFKDTLHLIEEEKFAVLRLDGDMYESTIQAFEALYPRLSVGGYLIVDDFHVVRSCRKAVADYRKAHGISEDIVEIDGSGVYWQRKTT